MKLSLFLLLIAIHLQASVKEHVFTGVLSIKKTGKELLTRVYFLNTVRPPKDGETAQQAIYSAIVSLHLGSFDNPEFTSLFYEEVKYNPQTREFWLYPNNKKEVDNRLPTIRLKANAKGLEGDYSSPGSANIGILKFEEGYNIPSTVKSQNILQALSGSYSAKCETDNSSLSLDSIYLDVSKFKFEKLIGTDDALNTINYIGNASCDYKGTKPSIYTCDYLEEGNYNFYKDEITFLTGTKEKWVCKRTSFGLSCNIPSHKSCLLTKKEPSSEYIAPKRKVEEKEVSISPSNKLNKSCGSWDGEYIGVLKHKIQDKQQWIKLNLETELIEGPQPPTKCAIGGTLDLIFGEDFESSEKITISFPPTEFVTNLDELILFPEKESDIILQIAKSNSVAIEGLIYSKLFGLIGELAGSSEKAKIELSKVIPKLSGKYGYDFVKSFELALDTSSVGPDPKSKNPFRQVLATGWLWVSGRFFLDDISYDYFTNHLILKVANTYRPARLHYTGIEEIAVLSKTIVGTNSYSHFFTRK
jgi:hypothetical protein